MSESTSEYGRRMKELNKKAQKPLPYKHLLMMGKSKVKGKVRFIMWHSPNLTEAEAGELYDYKYGLNKKAKREK